MTDNENDAVDLDEVLTLEQRQRQDALYSARSVIENRDAGGVFSKPGGKASVESFAALVSIAHFITSGDREYVLREGEHVDAFTPDVRAVELEGDEL